MSDKTEILQYNAALEIIDAIRETSKEIFYQELELESLRNRRGSEECLIDIKLFRLNRLLILMN